MAAIFAPTSSFAVDGVVLINQSTVMAGGGFPYIISQPGSYKLSGNLAATTTPTGNYAPLGIDAAIVIASSNVTLDLNGFSIAVTHTVSSNLHTIYGIVDAGSFSLIVVRNGMVTITGSGLAANVFGVSLGSSSNTTIEDMNVFTLVNFFKTGTPATFEGIETGTNSLVRHNVSNSAFFFHCPSLIVENFARGFSGNNAGACTQVNNVF